MVLTCSKYIYIYLIRHINLIVWNILFAGIILLGFIGRNIYNIENKLKAIEVRLFEVNLTKNYNISFRNIGIFFSRVSKRITNYCFISPIKYLEPTNFEYIYTVTNGRNEQSFYQQSYDIQYVSKKGLPIVYPTGTNMKIVHEQLIGSFPTKDMQISFNPVFMDDAQCAETNEK